MKKIYFLLMSTIGAFYLQSQTLLTVDPATEYQTVVGLGGGNGTSSDPNFLKYVVDFLGITQYRQWLQTRADITVDQINKGTVQFDIFTASNITYLKHLDSKGGVIIGSPLTPPACLKKSNCLTQRVPAVVGGPLICGQPCISPICNYSYADPDNKLLPEYYDEYARYLALYALKFKEQTGVNLYALSIQNEPMFNEPYGSALLYSYEFGKVLKAVHDTFAKYPALSNIKLFGPEHMCNYSGNSGGSGEGSKYIQSLLDSATYRPYLDAYAVHGYDDGITPDLGNASTWSSFANKVIGEHNKMLWMTETNGDFDEWADAYWYMKGMFMSFKSGKLSLYSYNRLEAFYKSGTTYRQLYNHMHYFRFIRPGAKMIKVTDTDNDMEGIGFKNGNDFTLVVINLVKTPKTVSLSNFAGKPEFFHVYRSTSTDMCAYAGKVTNNVFELPGESVVTITYNSANPNTTYGPQAPANLDTTSITDNSITISWDAVPGWTLGNSPIAISGYTVFINGVKKTTNGPTTKTTWTFTGLKPGTKNTIEIFSRDAMMNQSVSSSIEVTTSCIAGGCSTIDNNEPLISSTLTVFPNPAKEYVTVSLPDDDEYTISLIDVNGKTILNAIKIKDNIRIDAGTLPGGIYVVLAYNKSKIYKAKIAIE